jgi:hypothetical protein
MGRSACGREGNFRLTCGRNEIAALMGLFRSMAIRSAVPSTFSAAVFSGAAVSVGSVGIEDEDGTVFAADLDRLAGVGALVEQVAAWLRIVVGNPFPDGLPRRLDGIERLDVEGRGRWWRDSAFIGQIWPLISVPKVDCPTDRRRRPAP